MPAATNPTNYAPFFWELLKRFETAGDVITFRYADKSTAKRLQLQFHSFIRALERDAEKKKKQGLIDFARDREAEANLGRTRKVSVTFDGESWITSFMLRDSDPMIQSAIEQLRQQCKTAPKREELFQAQEETPQWKPTELPDFFKPSEGEGYNVEIAAQSDGDKASKN